MLEFTLLLSVGLVAYANGANDNFKGVATLYGSGTVGYRPALAWATITTLAGALAAVALSDRLIAAFSGKGIVPDGVASESRFLLAVGVGAGGTVLLASRLGFPVSTTHALLGGLLGAGLAATSGNLAVSSLGHNFVLPLLASPVLAAASAWILYPLLRAARLGLGVERRMCLCAGASVEPVVRTADGTLALRSTGIGLTVQQEAACAERYLGHVAGFDAQAILDRLHFLSAGFVGFARGMNDAPKIAALLVVAQVAGVQTGLAAVAVAMAVGGILGARRVAETMSHGITDMNHGQALTANLVTAVWVFLASRLGLPVSTTHVAVGSLAGIGASTGRARWRTLAAIGASWLTTLPTAAALSAAAYTISR